MATTSPGRAERLLETGLALAAELSLPALLQRIVDLAVELTDAQFGALGVLSEDGTHLVDFITTGIGRKERELIGALPQGGGILGALITDAKPLRLTDIAADPRSVGFPPHHPPMHSFLGAPVRAHDRVFGNIYLTNKVGAPTFSADDESSLVVLATQAGVAIANARLYDEVRARERWLDAVREVTISLLAGNEARSALQLVARRSRDLIDANVATISVSDGDRLRIVVADGEAASELQGLDVPIAGSLSAQVIASREPLRIDDARRSGLAQPMAQLADAGPMILVPVALRGDTVGVLAVGRRAGKPQFNGREIPVLESFAEQATLALEYASARQELSRLGMMEDRERIARDLHDGVIQSLFAVGLSLQGSAAFASDVRLAERIEQAVSEIDRVIGDLRSYIFGLRPSVLRAGGLADALDQLAHEFQARTGVTCVVEVDGTLEHLLADRAQHIAHIVREALSNVERHAGAETCRLSVRRDADDALIEVDDDGRGFELGTSRRGMGLTNLNERATEIGGRLEIDTAPGRGSAVRIRIPLEG